MKAPMTTPEFDDSQDAEFLNNLARQRKRRQIIRISCYLLLAALLVIGFFQFQNRYPLWQLRQRAIADATDDYHNGAAVEVGHVFPSHMVGYSPNTGLPFSWRSPPRTREVKTYNQAYSSTLNQLIAKNGLPTNSVLPYRNHLALTNPVQWFQQREQQGRMFDQDTPTQSLPDLLTQIRFQPVHYFSDTEPRHYEIYIGKGRGYNSLPDFADPMFSIVEGPAGSGIILIRAKMLFDTSAVNLTIQEILGPTPFAYWPQQNNPIPREVIYAYDMLNHQSLGYVFMDTLPNTKTTTKQSAS